jgi:hypothetical protein
METLMKKLLAWLPKNIAALLGIVQVVIKFVKEVATLALDLIAPLIPGDKDDKAIKIVRDLCNNVDGWVQKIKDFLLKTGI